MKNRQYNVLGIMSGTSCDGIDLAHCRFTFSQDNQWEFAINEAETIPYDRRWQKRLSAAINLHQRDIESLNMSYTALLNKVILEFIDRTEITELDLICSRSGCPCIWISCCLNFPCYCFGDFLQKNE